MIAAETFYKFSKIMANHKYLVTFDGVVDIAFQINLETRYS